MGDYAPMTADQLATPAREATRTRSAPRPRVALLLKVAAAIFLLDVGTKVLAVGLLAPGHPVSLIGDAVTCVLTRNSGAALSMAAGYTAALSVIVSGVVVAIVWIGRRLTSPWQALGFGLLLGGAARNLVDRLFRAPGPFRGHVVDFLSVGWLPVFNIADAAVLGGFRHRSPVEIAGRSYCGMATEWSWRPTRRQRTGRPWPPGSRIAWLSLARQHRHQH
jgi:signal peptidase II